MPSTQQQEESTFVPDHMAGSSTSPVSELRQRYARFSSGTCMLFTDDAAVATHAQEELRSLMDCFSQACKDFGLTISLKKTNVLGQDTEALPVITINDYELDAVCQFTYPGSTITDNLSLDADIDKRIGKADSPLARLTAQVWTSPKLSAGSRLRGTRGILDYPRVPFTEDLQHLPLQRVQEKQWGEIGYRMAVLTE